ncbi:GFA family protein [Jannaschia sp. S6380]|uniref:GFA family protein n=1 Tax=Jannaschia sp. S6380 TaxID=2926408 RepID=UPI001FF6B036|nr:GFA family protein [Jannaschia sp. S6380]MCK0168549.1 GFA family protein [Jannaschia sp. S6380]
MDTSQYRETGKLEGRCLCGAVRLQIDGGYTAAVGACHCAMCRRWAGTVFAGFDADADAVTVTGDVSRYRSSGFAERAFCPACGSHLWFRDDGDAVPYEFAPGAFAGAREFPLISEIYIDRAPVWARLAGEHRTATRAEYEARKPFVEGDDP